MQTKVSRTLNRLLGHNSKDIVGTVSFAWDRDLSNPCAQNPAGSQRHVQGADSRCENP